MSTHPAGDDFGAWLHRELAADTTTRKLVQTWLADELVGSKEVLALIRAHPRYSSTLAPTSVTRFTSHVHFPEPATTLRSGRLWFATDVIAFLDKERPRGIRITPRPVPAPHQPAP